MRCIAICSQDTGLQAPATSAAPTCGTPRDPGQSVRLGLPGGGRHEREATKPDIVATSIHHEQLGSSLRPGGVEST